MTRINLVLLIFVVASALYLVHTQYVTSKDGATTGVLP